MALRPPAEKEGAEVDGKKRLEESLSRSMVALVEAGPYSV